MPILKVKSHRLCVNWLHQHDGLKTVCRTMWSILHKERKKLSIFLTSSATDVRFDSVYLSNVKGVHLWYPSSRSLLNFLPLDSAFASIGHEFQVIIQKENSRTYYVCWCFAVIMYVGLIQSKDTALFILYFESGYFLLYWYRKHPACVCTCCKMVWIN